MLPFIFLCRRHVFTCHRVGNAGVGFHWSSGQCLLLQSFFFFFFWGGTFLVKFLYPVFTRMPGGGTVGDSGLCCCVPCLLSSLKSLRLLIPLLFWWRGGRSFSCVLLVLWTSNSWTANCCFIYLFKLKRCREEEEEEEAEELTYVYVLFGSWRDGERVHRCIGNVVPYWL